MSRAVTALGAALKETVAARPSLGPKAETGQQVLLLLCGLELQQESSTCSVSH